MTRIQKGLTLILLFGTLWGSSMAPAFAQAAEVPTPSRSGDFTTAKVQGNRGFYNNTKWLVTDTTALNCRTQPNGSGVTLRWQPGAVVTAVFAEEGRGNAIALANNQPWLRVRAIDPLTNQNKGVCYVRANIRYVAPINQDFVNQL